MFDPYHKWLGIRKEDQPPTHFKLLGLSEQEDDPEVIEEAALRQSAHVRPYQMGEHAQLCTRILNEIALAKTVLSKPAKRRAYLNQLAARGPAPALATAPAEADAIIPRFQPSSRPRERSVGLVVGLAVGGGVLIGGLIVGIIVLATRGSDPAAPVAQHTEKPKAASPSNLPPFVSKTPVEVVPKAAPLDVAPKATPEETPVVPKTTPVEIVPKPSTVEVAPKPALVDANPEKDPAPKPIAKPIDPPAKPIDDPPPDKLLVPPAKTQDLGKVFHFDGKSRIVTALERFAPVTMEAWIRPSDVEAPRTRTVLTKSRFIIGSDIEGKYGYGLAISYKSPREVGGLQIETIPTFFTSNDKPPPEKWSHVAAVIGKTSVALYRDGTRVYSANHSLKSAGGTKFVIGHVGANTELMYFVGEMGQIRISRGERYSASFVPDSSFRPDATSVLIYQPSRVKDKIAVDTSGNGKNGRLEGVSVKEGSAGQIK